MSPVFHPHFDPLSLHDSFPVGLIRPTVPLGMSCSVGGRVSPWPDLRARDEAIAEEGLDVLTAEPLDVEGVARDEMAQALVALRLADEATGAAAHHFAFFALRLAAADRAVVREDIGLAVLRPLLLYDLDHLGNDVAGALNDDVVALADVLARDLEIGRAHV